MATREELDGSPRELLARWQSYGPDWDAAVRAGIDVALIEENLLLTPAERIEQLDRMTRLIASLRPFDTQEESLAAPGHAGAPPSPR
ncbi:MAG: hypothetical protein EP329_27095 [Deltaproteobacteria bacterium]|nr:MAG: hypothetical protein EP329_27095 [Deltaproteobacteria bacterium]